MVDLAYFSIADAVKVVIIDQVTPRQPSRYILSVLLCAVFGSVFSHQIEVAYVIIGLGIIVYVHLTGCFRVYFVWLLHCH